MSNALSEVLGPILVTMVFGWLFNQYLSHRRWNRAAQIHSELQNKLLEKFSSTDQILQYLESDAGSRFIESATTVQADPYKRVLSSVQFGSILTLAGLSFLFLAGRITGAEQDFMVLGTLCVALGLGFLVSAVISYFLSRSWGLINGKPPVPEVDQAR